LSEIEPGFSICANVNVARAALQLGESWEPPLELSSRFPGSWITGMIHAMHCRHLIANDTVAAAEAINDAVRIATAQEAPGMLCYAQASMAFVADRTGEPEEAGGLRADAWELAVRLGRQTYLHDIFVHPAATRRQFGAFDLDNFFVQAVDRRAKDICIAQSGACPPSQFVFVRWLVQATLNSVVGNPPVQAPPFTLRMAERTRLAEFLAPQLGKDLAICLNFDDRAGFLARFVAALRVLSCGNSDLGPLSITAAS
jgi:hypothetical protein